MIMVVILTQYYNYSLNYQDMQTADDLVDMIHDRLEAHGRLKDKDRFADILELNEPGTDNKFGVRVSDISGYRVSVEDSVI